MKSLFLIIVLALLLLATTALSPTFAYPREGLTPRTTKLDAPPKHWIRTALRIGACEQPKPYAAGKKRYGFAAINWKQSHNYSFKGGLGMTNVLWDTFKRKGQPEDMHQAKPMEQIWASWRFYQWAERTYPGAGYTGWECSHMIGFYGFKENGSWK